MYVVAHFFSCYNGGIVKPCMRRKGDSNLDVNVHLNGCTVLFGHLPALLAVDCRAHLGNLFLLLL